MLLKNTFLCWLLLLCFYTSWSQHPVRPYEKLEFENLNPIWYETAYESELVSDTSNGYNCFIEIDDFKPVLKDGFIYTAYCIRARVSLYAGVYIEKRDLQTGELLWSDYDGFAEDAREEVPRLVTFNSEGNVVLVNQKRVAPYNEGDPYYMNPSGSEHMKLTRRVYDDESGALMQVYEPDIKDSTIVDLRWNALLDRGRIAHLVPLEDQKFSLVSSEKYDGPSQYFFTFDLDDQGRRISSIDSFFLPVNQGVLRLLPNISSKGFVYVEEKRDSIRHMKFKYLDKDLNLIKTVEADTIPNWVTHYLKGVSEDRILMYNYAGRHPERHYPLYDIVVNDRNGDLLMYARLDEDDAYSYDFNVLSWEHGDAIYVIGRSRLHDEDDNFYVALDVLKSNENNRFDIVKRIRWTDPRRGIAPDNSIYLKDEKKWVIFGDENAWELVAPPNGKGVTPDNQAWARSMMLLSEEDLGFTPPSKVMGDFENISSWKIYPNPTVDQLHIEFEQEFVGSLILVNSIGEKLRMIDVNGSKYVRLDVVDLNPGVHFVMARHRNGSNSTLKFVKVY